MPPNTAERNDIIQKTMKIAQRTSFLEIKYAVFFISKNHPYFFYVYT